MYLRIRRTMVAAVSCDSTFLISPGAHPGSKRSRHRLPFTFCSTPTIERLWPDHKDRITRMSSYKDKSVSMRIMLS